MEDECLIDANQSADKYYKRILDSFNKKKNYGDYATIDMIRNESVLSHCWSIIKAAYSKFHGYYEKIKIRKESGKTMVNWV